jgi:hypothetical protein
MPLWANILIWVVAIILGGAGWLFPIPWLDNRPFFRGTPSKAFRWFLVVVFLVLALSVIIHKCAAPHIEIP